jgi:hypothetical protein
MIRRHWIVTCDYCGREHRFDGNTKPTDQTLKDAGIAVRGLNLHFCNDNCAADYSHDVQLKRAGNLKQFQPGKTFERK